MGPAIGVVFSLSLFVAWRRYRLRLCAPLVAKMEALQEQHKALTEQVLARELAAVDAITSALGASAPTAMPMSRALPSLGQGHPGPAVLGQEAEGSPSLKPKMGVASLLHQLPSKRRSGGGGRYGKMATAGEDQDDDADADPAEDKVKETGAVMRATSIETWAAWPAVGPAVGTVGGREYADADAHLGPIGLEMQLMQLRMAHSAASEERDREAGDGGSDAGDTAVLSDHGVMETPALPASPDNSDATYL